MADLTDILKAEKGIPVSDIVSRLFGRKLKDTVIYGWHIDPSVSDPSQAVTYLADAVGMTPAAMGTESFSYGSWKNAFFMPRPCMLGYNGSVAYYLDPDDYTKKLNGTPSDVSNPDFEGNAMMEWGLIWYKFVPGEAEGEGSFYVSNRRIDSSYHCWCNINADNEITPHFYTAIYNSSIIGNRIRSLSGVTLSEPNITCTTAYEETVLCTANNTGSTIEWYTDLFCDRQLINALLVLIGKSLDTQSVFGKGIVYSNTSHAYTTGSLDTGGLFIGYTSEETSAVKVFGIENWWGYSFRRTAGYIKTSANRYLYKLTYGTADGSATTGYNITGEGYKDAGAVPYVYVDHSRLTWIKRMRFGEYGMVPSDVTVESASTADTYHNYFSDMINYYSDSTTYAMLGGMYNYRNKAGAFSTGLYFPSTERSTDTFTCLSCKPAVH